MQAKVSVFYLVLRRLLGDALLFVTDIMQLPCGITYSHGAMEVHRCPLLLNGVPPIVKSSIATRLDYKVNKVPYSLRYTSTRYLVYKYIAIALRSIIITAFTVPTFFDAATID